MLIVAWLLAVVVAFFALAYLNAAGWLWTAAIIAALAAVWSGHWISPLALLIIAAVLLLAGDHSEHSGAAPQSGQRCRADRVPEDTAADVANRARRHRGRHRVVGRRAVFRQSRLVASCSPCRAPKLSRRGAALPRPRVRRAVRDGQRLGDDPRLSRPAAARSGSTSRTRAFSG